MSHLTRTAAAVVVTVVILGHAAVSGHEMTVMGSVAGIEPARIQVKTGQEKKGDAPAWSPSMPRRRSCAARPWSPGNRPRSW